MLKIFGGMIIGSIITMVLLGGVSAADQVLANVQNAYLNQLNRPDAITTILLMALLGLLLVALNVLPTRPAMNAQKAIKHLRRHCS